MKTLLVAGAACIGLGVAFMFGSITVAAPKIPIKPGFMALCATGFDKEAGAEMNYTCTTPKIKCPEKGVDYNTKTIAEPMPNTDGSVQFRYVCQYYQYPK